MVDAKQWLDGETTGSPVDYTCEMDKYAEIKALVAGTTSFLLAPTGGSRNCFASLARTIDTTKNGLPADKIQTAIAVPSSDAAAQTICNNFTSGATTAYVVHVAEGTDASALGEFTTLTGRASGCLKSPYTTIVHGTALGTPEFTTMAGAGMRLVWSPKSNLFLYGATTRIDLALAAGLQVIALAPDWSLGGSINLLDELREADMVDTSSYGGAIGRERLVRMVTLDAARALGVDALLGSIEVGKRADLVLVDGDPLDPYASVVRASPAAVQLVMVDGRVAYGDTSLVAAGPSSPGCETVQICGTDKFLCAAQASAVSGDKLDQTYGQIRQTLSDALTTYDSTSGLAPFAPLAPLVKCP
jgi:hypothetical protein